MGDPGGPVVRALCFHCIGHGLGNKIPMRCSLKNRGCAVRKRRAPLYLDPMANVIRQLKLRVSGSRGRGEAGSQGR